MLPESIRELVAMHRYMRPAYGDTEAEFCHLYLDQLPGVYRDRVGNRIGQIGEAPTVMWCSHTDTVHKADGFQRLAWGAGKLSLHPDEKANCLGADCTVGVWLMRQMYLMKVPGLYVWHACEEQGGIGSDHIATKTPELLANIQYAIALDRKGYTSVITHQWQGRTASDTFAKALCLQLGAEWQPDSHGTFTDSANYADLVPECTNISVGYEAQHTEWETLDTTHAGELLGLLSSLNFDELPAARDPSYKEPAKIFRLPYGPDPIEDIVDLLFSRAREAAEVLYEDGWTAEALERDMDSLPALARRPGVYVG